MMFLYHILGVNSVNKQANKMKLNKTNTQEHQELMEG